MTDQEFTSWLKSRPRELSETEVQRRMALRDSERGPYTPPAGTVHHVYGESEG